MVLAFVLSLWPRPHARTARAYLSPVVGTLAATALSGLASSFGHPWRDILGDVALLAVVFQPFFLLRLVSVLQPVSRRQLWIFGGATGLAILLAVVSPNLPKIGQAIVALLVVSFFIGAEGYGTWRLWTASRTSAGSARSRAVTLAVASACVTLLLAAVLGLSLAHAAVMPTELVGAALAALALLYLAAAAPPRWLRHSWQMPVLLDYYEAPAARGDAGEEAVVGVLLETALAATGSVAGGFFEREPDRPAFTRKVPRGRDLAEPVVGAVIEAGPDDALERAWQSGKPVVVDVDSTQPLAGLRDVSHVRRMLVVPVRTGGRVVGLIRLFTPLDWLFLQDDLLLLEALAEHGGARLETARALAQHVAAADALREANRALAAANSAKSDFLSGMSHELRTPLNAIIGFSDLLLQPAAGELSERQRRYAGNILESGQHLLQIVNDVLDIAKADAARLDIRPTAVRLGAVVDAAVLLVRPQAHAGNVAVLDESDTGAWLWADELRARQALVNLLSNAVKFTPAAGRVCVRSAVREGFLELSVEDTGIGIAPEDLAAVFDEFTQVSHGTDRAYEGTGLGLPLVRRLMTAMGGSVRAESTVGVGSMFTLSFPLADGPAAAEPAARLVGRADGADGAQAPVLVVDDDPMVRELMRQVLGGAGYAVDAVAGLAAARQSIAARLPRVIVLDILLDEEYGDGLFASLASLRPRPRVVVASVVDAGRRALPGEVDDWLVKPVPPERLLDAVARALAADEPESEVVESGG